MIPLNRTLLVVRPALPYINWMRSSVGLEMSREDLQRSGGAYLIDWDEPDESVDDAMAQYWESIFEIELAKRTGDVDLWPAPRDLALFRKWFDVEIRDLVLDLGFDPVYVDPDELDDPEDWDDENFERFVEALDDNPLLHGMLKHLESALPEEDEREAALFHELYPPLPMADEDFDLSGLPDAGPTKGLIYQFKISLQEVEPTVWRRIQVPATYTFWDLHVALNDAMGWLDSHLHLFSVRDPKSGARHPIGIYDDSEPDCLPGEAVPIAAYFREPDDQAWYTYDFGDEWVHEVVLEEILPREKGKRYPKCLDGARACPPEDVGGPHGYAVMLRALSKRSDPEGDMYREWLGGDFDPSRFDPRKVRFDNPKKRFEHAFGPGAQPF